MIFGMSKGTVMDAKKSEVLQGTLDLMILKTLHGLGPLHGFGIARRIEQFSEEVLKLNEGTVYTSLLRLQQQGWITAEWGKSENNRKAKFYSITKSEPLETRTMVSASSSVLGFSGQPPRWASTRTFRTLAAFSRQCLNARTVFSYSWVDDGADDRPRVGARA